MVNISILTRSQVEECFKGQTNLSAMGTTLSRFRNQYGNAQCMEFESDPDYVTDSSSESDCACATFSNEESAQQWLKEDLHKDLGETLCCSLTADSFMTACPSGNFEKSFQSRVGFGSSVPCRQNDGNQSICAKHRLYMCGVDDKV